VRESFALRILNQIMKFRNSWIYRVVYKNPRICISVLVLGGIYIIYMFASFVISNVIE